MRRPKITVARFLWQYVFKFRFLFPVVGIFILYSLYNGETNNKRILHVEKRPVQQYGITEETRYRFEMEQEDSVFSEEKDGPKQHANRKESGNISQRELKLIADVKKFAALENSVDVQVEKGTFSPNTYPCSVNLSRILRQYDTEGFAEEQPINNINYSYTVNPYNTCKVSDNIKVLFIVKSRPDHTLPRTVIRETWANTKRFPSIRVIFSFGMPKYSSRLQALLGESSTHGDILIVKDYIDDYYNLTQKTIGGFKWAVTHCKHAAYVVSVDDDVYVAPDLLLRILDRPHIRKVERLFSGHLMIDTKPIRNPKDKWLVSMSEYPFTNYPNYIFGGFVIMSMSTVRDFTIAAMYTKLFKFEDVYLGILAAKIGIEATNNGYVNSKKTFTVSESFKTLIASHFYDNPKDLQRAWDCHLSILDQNNDKSIFCDYIGKRLQKLKSEIDSIISWMEIVKFNS
ncbi:beta-1,3-galactosyltransferase brn-like [Pecten maximus]|uniref:beta-1,3-galactosyltransferase brn-like n=1 Tax=Pecten maximus TaxID=6579 RepID=UPI001458C70E|nr:beta-1,3-galactosyltransferase brn-like [Pecten maximus]